MKTSSVARQLSNLPGFKKYAGFYIGTCNDDVVAGYCIDAPPGCIYIWRFALPAYDHIDYLHMTLGRRILALPRKGSANANIDITDFLRRDWSEFSSLQTRKHLIAYIDHERNESVYALWTRYITHIRNRDFGDAERLENTPGVRQKFLVEPAAKKFAALSLAKERDGWEGASALLGEWVNWTKTMYFHGKCEVGSLGQK